MKAKRAMELDDDRMDRLVKNLADEIDAENLAKCIIVGLGYYLGREPTLAECREFYIIAILDTMDESVEEFLKRKGWIKEDEES